MKYLDHVNIIYRSGYNPKFGRSIKTLRKNYYFIVDDYTITGDAPKDFIRLYEFGESKKSDKKNWPLYIAKTGHKWYPNESICEQLMTRLGNCFELNMATSKLAIGNNQLRFLSKYFLKKDQQLIHGAEIYSGFLSDEQFVEQIEREGKARDFFTIKFTKRALSYFFSNQIDQIFGDFIKMVIFDALVGNNDRHFYNWGVIRHVKSKHEPYFSPIYDTARGLYWNASEENLPLPNNSKAIEKYIENSKPKLGWENESDINHFKLIELIYMYRDDYNIDSEIFSIVKEENYDSCVDILYSEFNHLFSDQRKEIIRICLEKRFKRLEKILY